MTRTVTAVVIAVLAVPALALGKPTPRPSLKVVKVSPARVQGANFTGAEKVAVTLITVNGRHTRLAYTSASGAFLIAFDGFSVRDRCGGAISFIALGARGDRATRRLPKMACPSASGAVEGTTVPSSPTPAPPPQDGCGGATLRGVSSCPVPWSRLALTLALDRIGRTLSHPWA